MSSKQLKIYFLASLDLMPISISCSAGVWKMEIISVSHYVAKLFLINIFKQFNSNQKGALSLLRVFSLFLIIIYSLFN